MKQKVLPAKLCAKVKVTLSFFDYSTFNFQFSTFNLSYAAFGIIWLSATHECGQEGTTNLNGIFMKFIV